MADLQLAQIGKVYSNGVKAVRDFDLQIKDKEFIIFVGPSGCGKTTTLRMVAGLEEISSGQLFIDGVPMNDVPSKDRDIAMVFQNYALYPHMTVYNNMAFGLKLRKTPKADIKRRVLEAARILDIEELLERKPKALSGGQRQRVAMGRAIVRNPKVFLMDEPLSNLDAKLRVKMRAEIARLHRQLQTTFIYVTHDQTEAMTLGTRIVVMKKGAIQQVDTPANLYQKPRNLFVASFIGSPQMNLLDVRVEKAGSDVVLLLGADDGKVPLPIDKAKTLLDGGYVGREVVLGIRPEDLSFDLGDTANEEAKNTTTMGRLRAKADFTEVLGAETLLHATCTDRELTVRLSGAPCFQDSDPVRLVFEPKRLHLFDKETKLAIL